MKQVPPLVAPTPLALSLLSLASCASHPQRAAVSRRATTAAEDSDFQFDPVAGNPERNPPFGPRSNKSLEAAADREPN